MWNKEGNKAFVSNFSEEEFDRMRRNANVGARYVIELNNTAPGSIQEHEFLDAFSKTNDRELFFQSSVAAAHASISYLFGFIANSGFFEYLAQKKENGESK